VAAICDIVAISDEVAIGNVGTIGEWYSSNYNAAAISDVASLWPAQESLLIW